MGASQSTATAGGPADSTKHVFTASTPINFSSELVDSLQASSETNSTRAKSLDLHIAQRVHEELAKLQEKESSALEAARKRIVELSNDEEQKDNAAAKNSTKLSAKDLLPSAVAGESDEDKLKSQTSAKVQEEIEKLKTQLGQRKILTELPKDVEHAREGVIGCLRLNDRRPLDCWKEVEIFKREVKKMEDEFVQKVL